MPDLDLAKIDELLGTALNLANGANRTDDEASARTLASLSRAYSALASTHLQRLAAIHATAEAQRADDRWQIIAQSAATEEPPAAVPDQRDDQIAELRRERDDARTALAAAGGGRDWARLVTGLRERGELDHMTGIAQAVTVALDAIDQAKRQRDEALAWQRLLRDELSARGIGQRGSDGAQLHDARTDALAAIDALRQERDEARSLIDEDLIYTKLHALRIAVKAVARDAEHAAAHFAQPAQLAWLGNLPYRLRTLDPATPSADQPMTHPTMPAPSTMDTTAPALPELPSYLGFPGTDVAERLPDGGWASLEGAGGPNRTVFPSGRRDGCDARLFAGHRGEDETPWWTCTDHLDDWHIATDIYGIVVAVWRLPDGGRR